MSAHRTPDLLFECYTPGSAEQRGLQVIIGERVGPAGQQELLRQKRSCGLGSFRSESKHFRGIDSLLSTVQNARRCPRGDVCHSGKQVLETRLYLLRQFLQRASLNLAKLDSEISIGRRSFSSLTENPDPRK